jgi:hypothetical protein
MKNNICVYTCITGNYDSLNPIIIKESKIDYICFTNNTNILNSCVEKGWTPIFINDNKIDDLTLSRKIKILGDPILKKYKLLIWIDGSIKQLGNIRKFINLYCSDNLFDVFTLQHHSRISIYDELSECVFCNKESIANATKLENFLISEKYPKKDNLAETGILVKKNNLQTDKLMQLWFKMITDYSKRDQLSFNYCVWKLNINVKYIKLNLFKKNKYFEFINHSKNYGQKHYLLDFNNTIEKNFCNYINGEYNNNQLRKKIFVKVPAETNKVKIYFPNDCGNILLIKEKVKFMNFFEFNDLKIIKNGSYIQIDKKFKKNDDFELNFDIYELCDNNLINFLNDILKNINELKKKNNLLTNDINTLNIENKRITNRINELLLENNSLQKQ